MNSPEYNMNSSKKKIISLNINSLKSYDNHVNTINYNNMNKVKLKLSLDKNNSHNNNSNINNNINNIN